jgi:cytochrome b561
MAKFDNKINDRELLFAAHKSFGVLVLLLLGWRVYLLVRSSRSIASQRRRSR